MRYILNTLTALFLTAFSVAAPTYAATISISFDDAEVGVEATSLYVDQGVRFPSRPTIEPESYTNVLQQGTASGGPDPLPRTVRCAPLEMEFNTPMDVRVAQMRVFNRHLRSYSVIAYSGDTEVDRNEFFGGEPSGPPFSPIRLFRDISVRASSGEGGITRIVANPPWDCFDLMVIDNLVLETDGPITPFPRPNVFSFAAYEVTQGVMPRLTQPDESPSTPDTRLMALPTKNLVFVEGRDTAARFFLNASERNEANPDVRLRVNIVYQDGSTRTKTISENTAGGAVAVNPPVGETEDQRRQRLALSRANANQTADFVIPGRALQNASSMRLTLLAREPYGSFRPLHAIDVTFAGTYRLGLNVARVRGIGMDTAIGGPPSRVTTSLAMQFIEELYPITGNVLLRESGVLTMNSGTAGLCSTFLTAMDAAIAGTAAAAPIAAANYWSNMYILANTPPDCGGLGWYNRPGALTNTNFSTAAHEIGHNIGINHATGLHGEPRDREQWPYLHGSIGVIEEARGYDEGVFGALMITSTPGVDVREDWGSWNLSIVPPCGAGAAGWFPSCGLPDGQRMHDFMSYGPGGPTPPFGTQSWISDVNFHRIQRFMQDCTALDPANRFLGAGSPQTAFTDSSGACNGAGTPAAGASSSMAGAYAPNQPPRDALVFTGVIDEDNRVRNVHTIRKLAAANAFDIPSGAYYFVTYSADGQVLNRMPFSPRTPSGEAKTESQSFLVISPFEPKLAKIAIEYNKNTIYSAEMDEPAPSIKLVSPVGGENWQKGVHRIVWESEDPKASIYIQFSPDKGTSWYPLGLVGSDQNYLDVDVEDLAPSSDALVYVSAAKGFSTSFDSSSSTFRVRDAGEDCLRHDPEKLELKNIDGRWKIVEENYSLFDFENSVKEAEQALDVIKRFALDQTCYVGRPDPSMVYLRSKDAVPGGSSKGLDCIAFDPDKIGIREENGRWLLYSDRSQISVFPNKDEVQQALSVIETYRLNRQCFVKRPKPSFQFWLSELDEKRARGAE